MVYDTRVRIRVQALDIFNLGFRWVEITFDDGTQVLRTGLVDLLRRWAVAARESNVDVAAMTLADQILTTIYRSPARQSPKTAK